MDLVLPDFWQKEPYLSTGFVLEGFPTTADELRYLLETGLYPDGVVALEVESDEVIGRLLPHRIDDWRVRRERKRAFREQVKIKVRTKRDLAVEKRRAELIKERDLARLERQVRSSVSPPFPFALLLLSHLYHSLVSSLRTSFLQAQKMAEKTSLGDDQGEEEAAEEEEEEEEDPEAIKNEIDEQIATEIEVHGYIFNTSRIRNRSYENPHRHRIHL